MTTRIDCDTCVVRGLACHDCVVTVLLGPPPELTIDEEERRALDAKQEFDHVSRLVKQEAARFEQERVDDFKAALEAFLEGMIDRQKQVRGVVVIVFVCCAGCMGLMLFGLQLIGSWETYQQSMLKRITPPSNSSSDGVEVL